MTTTEGAEMTECKHHGCSAEATHTARICVQWFSSRWGGDKYDDVPYCTPHAEVLRAERIVVTPLEADSAA